MAAVNLLDCGSARHHWRYKNKPNPFRLWVSGKSSSTKVLEGNGFNDLSSMSYVAHYSRKAIGTIALKVVLDDLYKYALFHVIDANTSYNALLGRPWLHSSKSIVFTIHQFLKYNDDNVNERTIQGDPIECHLSPTRHNSIA
ncbi:hypothetical protein V2J09_013314 [Rumex salicifolius]